MKLLTRELVDAASTNNWDTVVPVWKPTLCTTGIVDFTKGAFGELGSTVKPGKSIIFYL